MSVDSVDAVVREGDYGTKVGTVEPGGAEFIPLKERHGKPIGLFATWMSPNLEFATIFLGVISVWYFQLTIWQAVLAALVGTGLGAIFMGILSARGPKAGVPQMIISRISFGYVGNVLPAGLNSIIAGVGWFAVNSVSGAFALATLTHMDAKLALLIVVVVEVVVAYFGHNLLQAWERIAFPILAVIFVLGIIFSVGHADVSAAQGGGGIGGFLIVVGATFGYAAGWNPFASDYTRYLSPEVSKRATGLWAGLGVFVSCFVLQVVGALCATYMAIDGGSPTDEFTKVMPTAISSLVLIGIVIGSISANAINLYSGSMSFLSMGFNLGAKARRVIAVVVFGILGALLAYWGLDNVASFENFLLVIAYWVGPWLGVFLMDQILRRKHRVDGFMFDKSHSPASGFLAMLIGMFVSIWLFSNQVF
jgi:NCS1 nucleoside transporter family